MSTFLYHFEGKHTEFTFNKLTRARHIILHNKESIEKSKMVMFCLSEWCTIDVIVKVHLFRFHQYQTGAEQFHAEKIK